jgi:hypothetical protein
MKRAGWWLSVLVAAMSFAMAGIWISIGVQTAEAIKHKPIMCEDELERVRTDLRLRTAELRVAHGQLDVAERKLKKCNGSSTDE